MASSSTSSVAYIAQPFNFSIPAKDYPKILDGTKITIGVSNDSDNSVHFQSLDYKMHTSTSKTGFALYSGSYGGGGTLPVPITILNVTSTEIQLTFGKSTQTNQSKDYIYLDLFLWATPDVAGNDFALYAASDAGIKVYYNFGHGESGTTELSGDSGDGTIIKWPSNN